MKFRKKTVVIDAIKVSEVVRLASVVFNTLPPWLFGGEVEPGRGAEQQRRHEDVVRRVAQRARRVVVAERVAPVVEVAGDDDRLVVRRRRPDVPRGYSRPALDYFPFHHVRGSTDSGPMM